MFSAVPLETFKQQVTRLEPSEKLKLDKYLQLIKHIQNKDKKKEKEALKNLEKFTDLDLFKFSENSSTFKDFIQKPDCALTQYWPAYLKKKGCIAENLTYSHGKKHTLYDEYLGAYLFSEYLKNKDSNRDHARKYLDLACEHGLFQALRRRCQLDLHIISHTKNDQERSLALGQVMQDAALLSSLYGSIGHFYAAKFLNTLGKYYLSLNNDDFASTAHYFLKLAAESFYIGKELFSNQASPGEKAIIQTICGKDGLLHFKFQSWQKAEDYFFEKLDTKLSSRQDIYTSAMKKAKRMHSQHPVSKPS
jgi:hypothetical protein